MSDSSRLTKNEKREAAREKARQLREEQKKKDRRNKLLLQGGIIVASMAIVAVIVIVFVNFTRPAGPGPLNMASDGIQIGQGLVATQTPALQPGDDPVPTERADDELNIQIFVDYLCPICRQFEETNGDYITSLLNNGGVTVDIHPITILDRASQGTRYSTRSANAAACVANYSPNQFYKFHLALFENQPAESTAGLTDDEIIAIAEGAGVKEMDQVSSCITSQQFRSFVDASTKRALSGPIPGTDVEKVTGTPTVIVNGVQYSGPINDLASFQAFIVKAAGETFNQTSTPTPTPTPTP